MPQGALEHMEVTHAQGRPHYTTPVARRTELRFINTFSLPIPFDARPHRCHPCRGRGPTTTGDDDDTDGVCLADWGMCEALSTDSESDGDECLLDEAGPGGGPRTDSESDGDECLLDWAGPGGEPSAMSGQPAQPKYWTVGDDDVRRVFPDALVFRPEREAPVWVTPLFVLELCTIFYEHLNARETRRQLASIYAANALAWQVRQHSKQASPYSLAWALGTLPKSKALRPLIRKVFSTFVRARVRVMRRRQIAYNSQGLRHDGNYKLAKILIDSVDGMQCTVVFALCGVDGSLIDVPAPLPTEAWPHIVKVLGPLLREIQQVRLECGFGLLESMPVFHSRP